MDSKKLLLCGPAVVELLICLKQKQHHQRHQKHHESTVVAMVTSGCLNSSTPEPSFSFSALFVCLMVWICRRGDRGEAGGAAG